MAARINKKRFLRELQKLEPIDTDLFDEQSHKLRTLFLVLAGDKRVIDDLNMNGIAELFSETPELLTIYNSQIQSCFDASQLVDYQNTLRRAL